MSLEREQMRLVLISKLKCQAHRKYCGLKNTAIRDSTKLHLGFLDLPKFTSQAQFQDFP